MYAASGVLSTAGGTGTKTQANLNSGGGDQWGAFLVAAGPSGTGLSGTTIGPISVAADADDGLIISTTSFLSSGSLADGLGDIGSGDHAGFFRFVLPSSIPSGATIISATLELTGLGTVSWVNGTDDLTVSATASANASAPTTAAATSADFGGSTAVTTAHALWDNVTWNTSGTNTFTGLAPVIQELVTTYGGLSSSAGIVLWVAGHNTFNAVQEELNEKTGSANVAKLTIVYSP